MCDVLFENKVFKDGIADVANTVSHVGWTIEACVRATNFRFSVQIELRLPFDDKEKLVLRMRMRRMRGAVGTHDAKLHGFAACKILIGEPILISHFRRLYSAHREFIHTVLYRIPD